MSDKAKDRRVQVRLPLELAEKVEREAKEKGVAKGVVIRWAVKNYYTVPEQPVGAA